MTKKNSFAFFLLLLLSVSAHSQQGRWEAYLAQYDDGPGSTVLNMDLIKVAPVKDQPFILITGVTYKNCEDDGFPKKNEFDKLYKISDEVVSLVSGISKAEFAGSFTSQCQRLDYLYVKDTNDLRTKLENLYQKKFKGYQYYINIKQDAEWEAYRGFLYPNEETQEYLSNQQVLDQLTKAGDKLTQSRPVDHFLYFAKKEDRDLFIVYSNPLGFKVAGEDYQPDSEWPYQLHLVREDPINVASISKVTLQLRKKAEELGGKYDGWETVVVKE